MEHPTSSATREARQSPDPLDSSPSSVPHRPEDFPGCDSFHLPVSEVERYEGRFEFWDARTRTAWKVRDPTTIWHERPAQMLSQIAREIASLRGSRIECFGSADLLRSDASGRKRWIMQADQVLYLHPGRSRPQGSAIDVVAGPLPDVVLEVDYSTNIRRRKLSIYEESGFPEVWELVPPQSLMRRPKLTIHVHGGVGGYEEAPESAAFPGWKEDEVFRALTEDPWSESTRQALERVALAMGRREGTGPEDDPLSRSLIRRGEARGRSEGYAKGRGEERMAFVHAVLRARGINVGAGLAEESELLGALPADALIAAAKACTDETDFLSRVREASR